MQNESEVACDAPGALYEANETGSKLLSGRDGGGRSAGRRLQASAGIASATWAAIKVNALGVSSPRGRAHIPGVVVSAA